MTTRCAATDGELSTGCPISYDHSSVPLSSESRYSRPSSEPTITLSAQTTGELSTLPRVANDQRLVPVSRVTQCTSLSLPPNTTRSAVTAGDEKKGKLRS